MISSLKSFVGLVFWIILTMSIYSCRKDPANPSQDTTCPQISGDTTNVSYSLAIKPIFEKHCISCHQPGNSMGNILLNSYQNVQTVALNGKLEGAIMRKSGYTPMPPSQTLPACLTNPILTWIHEGSRNN